MRTWSSTFRGALGTFLYDTYGWDIFSLNFSEDYANMFKGLRVDSGDNYAELDKIVASGCDKTTSRPLFLSHSGICNASLKRRTTSGRPVYLPASSLSLQVSL